MGFSDLKKLKEREYIPYLILTAWLCVGKTKKERKLKKEDTETTEI